MRSLLGRRLLVSGRFGALCQGSCFLIFVFICSDFSLSSSNLALLSVFGSSMRKSAEIPKDFLLLFFYSVMMLEPYYNHIDEFRPPAFTPVSV